jgi:hypothetical protein
VLLAVQDSEAEVRAAAAKNLSGYISIIKNELFTSEILPLLSSLSQDTAPNVRSTWSSLSVGLLQLLLMFSCILVTP